MREIPLLGFLVALGCAGKATSGVEMGGESGSGSSAGGAGNGSAGDGSAGNGSAGNASAGNASVGSSTGEAGVSVQCGIRCSSPFLQLQMGVISSAGIGEIRGVQATLIGPVTAPLNCSGFAGTTRCFPTEGAPEGIYLLEANAPGFQTAVVSITVTFTPAEGCGCASASAYPSLVALNPARL